MYGDRSHHSCLLVLMGRTGGGGVLSMAWLLLGCYSVTNALGTSESVGESSASVQYQH